MKNAIKKLAIAAGVTSALAGSMAAQAALQGLPGEAALVPFVYYADGDHGYGDKWVGGANAEINTIIRFQTALSVGNDTMIQFTAPHVMQGGQYSNQKVGLESNASPGWAVSTGNPYGLNKIHWILMDRSSVHLYDDAITVSADDVRVFDVGHYMHDINLVKFMGYLIAVTETAYTGNNAADFAFFTDAYLTMYNASEGESPAVASLPSLPMADGADTTARPQVYNEVITLNQVNPIAAPIAAGIRTSGQNPYRVFDVTLSGTWNGSWANAGLTYPATRYSSGTLLVTWNDRNLLTAGSWAGYAYDDDENRVSRNLSVPRQLNTARAGFLYAPTTGTGGQCSSTDVSLLCPASIANFAGYDGDIPLARDGRTFQTGEGFYKVFVPRPAGSATTGMSDSAMYAFSIPLVGDDDGGGYYDFYTNFWKAHDHGTFTGQ